MLAPPHPHERVLLLATHAHGSPSVVQWPRSTGTPDPQQAVVSPLPLFGPQLGAEAASASAGPCSTEPSAATAGTETVGAVSACWVDLPQELTAARGLFVAAFSAVFGFAVSAVLWPQQDVSSPAPVPVSLAAAAAQGMPPPEVQQLLFRAARGQRARIPPLLTPDQTCSFIAVCTQLETIVVSASAIARAISSAPTSSSSSSASSTASFGVIGEIKAEVHLSARSAMFAGLVEEAAYREPVDTTRFTCAQLTPDGRLVVCCPGKDSLAKGGLRLFDRMQRGSLRALALPAPSVGEVLALSARLTPPALAVVTAAGEMWMLSTRLAGRWAGPMYPAGFELLPGNRAYSMREDDLDAVDEDGHLLGRDAVLRVNAGWAEEQRQHRLREARAGEATASAPGQTRDRAAASPIHGSLPPPASSSSSFSSTAARAGPAVACLPMDVDALTPATAPPTRPALVDLPHVDAGCSADAVDSPLLRHGRGKLRPEPASLHSPVGADGLGALRSLPCVAPAPTSGEDEAEADATVAVLAAIAASADTSFEAVQASAAAAARLFAPGWPGSGPGGPAAVRPAELWRETEATGLLLRPDALQARLEAACSLGRAEDRKRAKALARKSKSSQALSPLHAVQAAAANEAIVWASASAAATAGTRLRSRQAPSMGTPIALGSRLL